LSTWYLFCNYKLSTGVILIGLVKHKNDLHGKIDVSIKVLMQCIKAALAIL
jgi:hypothetical protein